MAGYHKSTSLVIMATKRQAEWAPALTVRLEAELAERLREFCYRRRLKKQPVLRLAVQRLIELVNSEMKQKRATLLECLRTPPVFPFETKEKLVLGRDEFESLRQFIFEHNTHKQHVARVALIDYLDSLDPPPGL